MRRAAHPRTIGPTIALLVLAGCAAGPDPAEDSAPTVEAPAPSPSADDPAAGETPAEEETEPVTTLTVGPREELRVTDASVSVECLGGGEVYLLTDGATVRLTGTCDDIDLVASGLDVTAESATDVDILGSSNVVDIGEARDLDIEGNDNRVTIGAVREIDLEGDRNTVTVTTGRPEVDDDGRDNAVILT